MAIVPLDTLYQRGKHILHTEGWRAFLRQGFAFVGGLFFRHGRYYIYEKELSPADEQITLQPRIDCTPKVISSQAELADLEAQGYDLKALVFTPRLEKGAIAFCLFVGQELASVTWVAPNREAKQEVDYVPFSVDFERGEVCSGASFTDHKFRGKALFGHTYSHIFSHLAKRGLRKDKFSIGVKNTASQKGIARFNPAAISKGRYLRILFWESWKEQPVGESER